MQAARAAAKAKTRISILGLDQIHKSMDEKSLWRYAETQARGMLGSRLLGLFNFCVDLLDRYKYVFSIWLTTLKTIEGKFGSAVMITFAFLRFVFLLNVMLSLVWILVIIIPFFTHPPVSYNWDLLQASNANKKNYLGSTWLFYGGYNYTAGEQMGWYRTDYMYTIVVGAMPLITMTLVLYRMASQIMGTGDVTNAYSSVYPFSTVSFASWDFHLTTGESSSNLQRGIRMRLREMLADFAEHQQEVATQAAKLYKRNLALFGFFPILMACTVMSVIVLVSKQAEIEKATKFMKGFAQPLLLSLVNNSTPRLIRMLVEMEDWKTSTAEQVLLVKLYFVRMLNVGTLFYRLYIVLEHARTAKEGTVMRACGKNGKCTDGLLCCLEQEAYLEVWPTCRPAKIGYCVADCADNAIAKLLLELIATSTVIDNATEVGKGLFARFYRKTRMQMSISEMPIKVVYIQAVVWVGSMFSPIACIVGATSNFVSFHCMKEVLMRTCAPMEKAYSASSTSNITFGLLLITLILASIPIVFRLTTPSSGICGPVKEGVSSYEVITNYLEKAPTAIWVTFEWLTNPMVSGGVILLLLFIAILLRAKISQIQRSVELTANELGMHQSEAREKVALARIEYQAKKAASGV